MNINSILRKISTRRILIYYTILILVCILILILFLIRPRETSLYLEQSVKNITNISQSEVKVQAEENKIEANLNPKFESHSEDLPCEGTWFELPSTGRIDMEVRGLDSWSYSSSPMFVGNTMKSNNIVGIGHNWCPGLICDKAGNNFAKIMNVKEGDYGRACIDGKLSEGYVVASKSVDGDDLSIMNDWTGFPVITLFTSYGTCKDRACSSTDQRWMIAFER